MTQVFSVEQAQKKLGQILDLVGKGEKVQISRNDVPVVELISLPAKRKRPLLGEFEPLQFELTPELLSPLHSQEEWEEILLESDREFLNFLAELNQEDDSK